MIEEKEVFRCKQFKVQQSSNVMKVNSDGMLLGAWSDVDDNCMVLDIGTGTGIIALMLAQRSVGSIIHGVEIEKESSIEANYNFSESPWKDRMQSIHSSIQDYSRTCEIKYDLIVSNPPFFSGGTFSANENKNNVRHTTKLSHGDLLISVSRLLSNSGRFDVVLPYIEGERFIDLCRRYDLFERKVTCMRPREGKSIERLLISLSREKLEIEREELVMYASHKNGDYTDEYKLITKEFYLKF